MSKHRTGWMSQSNLDLTQITFRVPQETADQLTEGATLTRMSKRQFLKHAIEHTAQAAGAAQPGNSVVIALDPQLVETAREVFKKRHSSLEKTLEYFLRSQINLRNG